MDKGDDGGRRIAIVSCGKLVGEGDEKVLLVFNLSVSSSIRKTKNKKHITPLNGI